MKIKGIRLHISPMYWAVFTFFVVMFIVSYFVTHLITYLYMGLPLCFALLLLPLFSSYSLGSQYIKLLPEYEAVAKPVRLKNINLQKKGKPVRVEGIVQSISGKFFDRPKITISDGETNCIVFRAIPLEMPIAVGDKIEAVGMVVNKYNVAGILSVHGVAIWKRDNSSNVLSLEYEEEKPEKTETTVSSPESSSIKIKKYN